MQSCHAAIEARHFFPANLGTPNLILLGVDSEQELFRVLGRIQQAGIKHQAFYEPDVGDQLTAIATEPVYGSTRRFFKKYSLFNSSLSLGV